MTWIYILHFDIPLFHAKHYTGSTANLKKRLEDHANGLGSNLCYVLKQKSIEWTLSSVLYVMERPKLIERALKNQKHAHRYCGICTEIPLHFNGAIYYPIEALNLPITSGELRHGGIRSCQ